MIEHVEPKNFILDKVHLVLLIFLYMITNLKTQNYETV